MASGTASVRNTILAKNSSTSGGQDCSADAGATISSSGHNLESGTDCGFASITDRQNADPLLDSLGFNGGATQTHALGPGSPAIDSGAPGCPVVDQRGVSRPQGPSCDIGAFELPQSIVVPPDQTPPETTIVSGPTGPTVDRTPTFVFSASEPGSRFECSVDDGPFQPCTSPFTTAPLPPGRHTLKVRAIDAAGNVDATPSVAELVIEALTVAELPDPVQGETLNVQEVSGIVLVGLTGAAARAARNEPGARTSQKGVTFVPLSEARQVPVGSFLDTRRGTVKLQSARDRLGTRQTGTFLNSLFQVRQSRKRRLKGMTDLVLKGGSFSRCRTVGKGKPTAALSRRQIRRLRANARGRFRTNGRNSSATVRGTIWDIADRCDGTLTKVRRGSVVVRDFRRKRNIVVRAGKSYLARAPG